VAPGAVLAAACGYALRIEAWPGDDLAALLPHRPVLEPAVYAL
jgi:hypothetical protein